MGAIRYTFDSPSYNAGMIHWKVKGLAIVALLLVQTARAAVFERDWQTAADGLLTYDDANQREWLDLPVTVLSQFPGANRELKFQYVADQTAPGGLFDGFTVAKSADVIALAQSAGVDLSTFNYATNAGPTLALGTLLGFTFEPANGSKCAIGLLDELGSVPILNRMGATLCIIPTSQAGIDISNTSDLLFDPLPAVLLFRPIPEPSTAYVLLLACGGLSLVGRRFP